MPYHQQLAATQDSVTQYSVTQDSVTKDSTAQDSTALAPSALLGSPFGAGSAAGSSTARNTADRLNRSALLPHLTRMIGLGAARTCHKVYKLTLSPLIGNQCRFFPSCSDYALGAIEHHGCARGALLAAKRIMRCSPLHDGGFDPVPPSSQMNDSFK